MFTIGSDEKSLGISIIKKLKKKEKKVVAEKIY